MLALEWRHTARADLLAILDYTSDDNPDAAQRLKDDIEAKVARLRPCRAHGGFEKKGRERGCRKYRVSCSPRPVGDASQFPPLGVARWNDAFILYDGWHRTETMERLGLDEARVEVREAQSFQEVKWWVYEANMKHG